MKSTKIVVGYGFGDEGKGNTVNWLSSQNPNTLVVRFNGGQQAGHAAFHEGKFHEFASIGAGSLNGSDTFISKYCTVFPTAFNIEWGKLQKIGITPRIYVDPFAMVTTPFDVETNRAHESYHRHGSCGAGFGKTVWRHETLDHSHRIFAIDLQHEWILKQKLLQLAKMHNGSEQLIDPFIESCNEYVEKVTILGEENVLNDYEQIVFEGAQGILLDRQHGIFPHVTRSNTTSKNAIEICQRNNLPKPDIYGILRCYSTRHGNGPLKGECSMEELGVVDNNPTNFTNDWQGKFRYAPFDFELYRYAFDIDNQYFKKYCNSHQLAITCFDHIETDEIVTTTRTFAKDRFTKLFRDVVITSSSNDSTKYENAKFS